LFEGREIRGDMIIDGAELKLAPARRLSGFDIFRLMSNPAVATDANALAEKSSPRGSDMS